MNYPFLVPYAGQNPPMLVGCALCRAEPWCRPGAEQTVPHHMPFKRTGELPPVVDSTCVPPFPAACGWCPLPGGALRDP